VDILNLLFPRSCLGCNKEGTYLCQDCKETLDILYHTYCFCQKDPTIDGKCPRCSSYLSGLFCALSFKEKALTRKLIHCYRDNYLKDAASTLALLIMDHLYLLEKDHLLEKSTLVPLFLDVKEVKKRGYDQNEELCKSLSEILGIPLQKGFRKTDPVLKPVFENNISGRVFLVADLYTPNCMEDCAWSLKEAGAKEVFGLAIARDQTRESQLSGDPEHRVLLGRD